MYKIFLAIAALVVLASGYYFMKNRVSQLDENIHDPRINIQKSSDEPENGALENELPEESVTNNQNKAKKGLVISRPISPDDEKPKEKDGPEVNEYGRKMVPEPETTDKKSLKASQEFNDQKENPADYDNVPMPEKDMDLNDYYNKKKRDD